MKKYLLFLIIVSACACKKTVVSPGLFGKWELRRVSGGDFAYQDSVFKPGNGNIYQFNNDSTYKVYTNHTLTLQGTFHIRKNTNSTIATIDILILDNTAESYPIGIDGTSMTLVTMGGWLQDNYQKISD